MSSTDSGRILSVQSHVAYGYVGGKAAVFPLQCLGYDVDVVHTVHFSNHAGYARAGGTKTSATELKSIFEAMQANELLNPTRLLTGYIPNAEALGAVKDLAEKLLKQRDGLIYLLDPVMGDSGRLYVAPDVIPVYKSMLPLATIITPNWFEVETLTDTPLTSLSALRSALNVLHTTYRVPHVVISSIPLQAWLADALPTNIKPLDSNQGQYLLCIASSRQNEQKSMVYAQTVPLLPGYFSGVGDLFSALLLGHYHPSESLEIGAVTPLSHATSLALSKTHLVLTRTLVHSQTLPREEQLPTDDELDKAEPLRKIRRMRGRELQLVQSLDIITGQNVGEHGIRELVQWEGF
ncbi:pyridoxine kinase [Moniliophthora roreri MCA 2997]|uniref:pyridoxal kinase n=2 Tax=Moniliophthora roreri TaxID=221103 RepID=V2XRN6_MONRO|nr:pyridoxine kinase [Moniliophthora roreri MCA 2997]